MNIDNTIKFARDAHRGQKRRNGEDYFNAHVFKVYELAKWYTDSFDCDKDSAFLVHQTALLHDTVEDTGVTLNCINVYFGYYIRSSVSLLTKQPHSIYSDYIINLIGEYNRNSKFGGNIKTALQMGLITPQQTALLVKYFDLMHNMSDFSEKDKRGSQYSKYALARHMIKQTLQIEV